ncbi:MAG: hypothetical protein ISP90_07575 [Nevskia sp.]|nr:hypothetical protein [Nevskia sp.]
MPDAAIVAKAGILAAWRRDPLHEACKRFRNFTRTAGHAGQLLERVTDKDPVVEGTDNARRRLAPLHCPMRKPIHFTRATS